MYGNYSVRGHETDNVWVYYGASSYNDGELSYIVDWDSGYYLQFGYGLSTYPKNLTYNNFGYHVVSCPGYDRLWDTK